MGVNEHTGARLVSKPTTKEYEDNFDRIFRKEHMAVTKRFTEEEVQSGIANSWLKEQGEKNPHYVFTIETRAEGTTITGKLKEFSEPRAAQEWSQP